jgi:uncharacterized protein
MQGFAMPFNYSYPGAYVEEIPEGVHTIRGANTSDTAFVDFFRRGPLNKPTRITSYSDFERFFGGLDARSKASYAMRQFFLNGGRVAWAVRIADGAFPAVLELEGGSISGAVLTLEAASPGNWGKNVHVAVGSVKGKEEVFNLAIREVDIVDGRTQVVSSEVHLNLSMEASNPRYVKSVLDSESSLVKVKGVGTGEPPAPDGGDVASCSVIADTDPAKKVFKALGGQTVSDGKLPISSVDWINGLRILDGIAPYGFNILCLPAVADLDQSTAKIVYGEAASYCEVKRAFLIMDIPESITSKKGMEDWMAATVDKLRHRNAAIYFPRLEIADQLNENRPLNVASSGTIAGLYARIDAGRGVWKAPAGAEAGLSGVTIKVPVTESENGDLNQIGINVLRNFPNFGNVCWGARTLVGTDQQASDWKYIAVRRTALYIEECLYQGLKWVVFEPNNEPLWAQIRMNVGAFMFNLFGQGAFHAHKPSDAYFVKCDEETITQSDIDAGIVNILVGFAPLKPAEFVVIKIQQMACRIKV